MIGTQEDTHFYSRIGDVLKDACSASSFFKGDFTITLVDASHLVRCVTYLRNHSDVLFHQLTDVTAVDYPARPKRFEMVYHFLSMAYNKRLRLKVAVAENEEVPSIVSIFDAANWYEREVYDLFGIVFKGHPDLRRILTDYDFEGFPLRKDFPLSGYYDVRYDENQGKIVREPVVLPQAFRQFDYMSPWEEMGRAAHEGGATNAPKLQSEPWPTYMQEDGDNVVTALPGDEKARTSNPQFESKSNARALRQRTNTQAPPPHQGEEK